MGKFYSVKNGRNIGIYTSWDECRKQIEGFKGAIYKSFSSYEEAKRFIEGADNKKLYDEPAKELLRSDNEIVRAYVDGSYSDLYNMYSYGVVILYKDTIVKFSGKDNKKDNLSMRNVAGELLGATEAIKWAISNKIKNIQIYYDYEGIEKWATGIWKTNKEGTKKYKEFIDSNKNIINVNFIKVKAHSGVTYNEQADILAKSEFNNIDEVAVKEELDNKNRIYINMFNSVMKKEEKSKSKTQCSILFKGLIVTDNKLKKLSKEIWKLDNKDINDIENINVQLDVEERILIIEIIDVLNNVFKYNIILEA